MIILSLVIAAGVVFPVAPQDTSLELSCLVFSPRTSEADLIARFGARNVTAAPVIGMDDGATGGTILFADSPDARAEITWRDSLTKQQLGSVIVRGAATRWRLRNGVVVGTDLKTLERANARPFRIAGLSTEAQGRVISWAGGALEQDSASAGCVAYVHLQPPSETTENFPLVRQVRSGREYSSAHPALQALNPRVVLIRLSYAR